MAIMFSRARLFSKRKTNNDKNNTDRRKSITGLGRKTKSLQANRDGTVKADGVFVSARTLASFQPCSFNSLTSISSGCDSSTTTTTECSGTCRPTSWKLANSARHNMDTPVVVASPDCQGEDCLLDDDATEMRRIIARHRKLPGTWYYSSNHILVNQERNRRFVAPLRRLPLLDLLARLHAEQLAAEEQEQEQQEGLGQQYTRRRQKGPQEALRHVNADALRWALDQNHLRYTRLGENVAKGTSVRGIHNDMMATLSNRNNIVDRRFTHMGMGTAVGRRTGQLYLCQIFRG